MAFPKEKTDWLAQEKSLKDEERLSDSGEQSRNLPLPNRAGATRKVHFFKSISINEPQAPQERVDSPEKCLAKQTLNDNDAPRLAVPKLGAMLLGALLVFSKGSLVKGNLAKRIGTKRIGSSEAPPLLQIKQLIGRKQKRSRNRLNALDSANTEFSATTHHSNVTRYEIEDHSTSLNSDRSSTSFNAPTIGEIPKPGGLELIKQEDPVVRCPSCQTRFYVDSEVLAKYQQSGRKPQFHCSKCDHVFSSSITAFSSAIDADSKDSNWQDLDTNGLSGSDETSGDQTGEASSDNLSPRGDHRDDEASKALRSSQANTLANPDPQANPNPRANTAEGHGFDHAAGKSFDSTSSSSSKLSSIQPDLDSYQGTDRTNQTSQDISLGALSNNSSGGNSHSAVSTPSFSIPSSSKGVVYPDDDQPLVTHFDDEVKPQNIPWEVKRSTSEGSLQRSLSISSTLSTKMVDGAAREDANHSPEPIASRLGNSESDSQSGNKNRAKHYKDHQKNQEKNRQKNQQKKGLGDSLSIWSIAKKVLSPGGSRPQASKELGPHPLSAVHPYLNSSQRRPNSAPIESANTETDQLPLSLRPSRPSSWNFLTTILARGPRERWVGASLLGAPLLVAVIILAVFSYTIRFSLPAYEIMSSSLGLKRSEIAPVGLTVHEATFKSVVLESGETVYTISGRVVNSTDRNFKEISVEGLTFNAEGKLTSKGSATLGNALNIAKLKALPLDDILSLQQTKRDVSSILKPGQSEKFIIALSDRNLSESGQVAKKAVASSSSLPKRDRAEAASSGATLAETEFFSARVYLVN